MTSWNLTDQCTFVRSVPSCEPNMGFVDYLELIYCMMGPANHFYAVGLSVSETFTLSLFACGFEPFVGVELVLREVKKKR